MNRWSTESSCISTAQITGVGTCGTGKTTARLPLRVRASTRRAIASARLSWSRPLRLMQRLLSPGSAVQADNFRKWRVVYEGVKRRRKRFALMEKAFALRATETRGAYPNPRPALQPPRSLATRRGFLARKPAAHIQAQNPKPNLPRIGTLFARVPTC